MKKNYLIIAFLTIIFLFTTAAICNLNTDNLLTEANNKGESTDAKKQEDDPDTEESVLNDIEAPSISLSIHEGPLYSEADDICYYRIIAEVCGKPHPDISWSKDNSDRAFGENIAQINLRRGETYTLIATATNSVDVATDSIALAWGCDGGDEVAEGNEEIQDDSQEGESGESSAIEIEAITVPLTTVPNETGCVSKDRSVVDKTRIHVGKHVGDKNYTGYISFDISSFSGKSLESVKLYLHSSGGGFPLELLGDLKVGIIEYGTGGLTASVVGLPSSTIGSFHHSTEIIEIENDVLKNILQSKIDEGKSRFQVKLYWSNPEAYQDSPRSHDRMFEVSGPYTTLYITY